MLEALKGHVSEFAGSVYCIAEVDGNDRDDEAWFRLAMLLRGGNVMRWRFQPWFFVS